MQKRKDASDTSLVSSVVFHFSLVLSVVFDFTRFECSFEIRWSVYARHFAYSDPPFLVPRRSKLGILY
jgi:hypothetical protein